MHSAGVPGSLFSPIPVLLEMKHNDIDKSGCIVLLKYL